MLLLGIDLGTSAIKVSVVDVNTQQVVASAQYPDDEAPIIAHKTGWAEQDPERWWHDVKAAFLRVQQSQAFNPKDIIAIGIAYQMHGLVMLDKNGNSIRNSIIWCDSRAVPYGDAAFAAIGEEKCLGSLLNSPGNFTASKLAWVKENEPENFERIHKIMLPGDFIAYKLTGEITSSPAALSEGILWDFSTNTVAKQVLDHFGFSESVIPTVKDVFTAHGQVTATIAEELNLTAGIPVTYKAGDQPNNALSLNVMKPGEVAATAGTSGVIYGVTDVLLSDRQSRLNSFAHVNHTASDPHVGVLLCINGCGIMNKMIKQWMGADIPYKTIDQLSQKIAPGSDGLTILPFGNGAERMLNNAIVGAQLTNLDLNLHTTAHFYRAVQEGIAFAFRYGLDIMKANGLQPAVMKAGNANMFLSPVFREAFVECTQVPVELYSSDGARGAALGAGVGVGVIAENDLGKGLQKISSIEPTNQSNYEEHYQRWLHRLQQNM
ncbi:MAG TPA: FGGY family carbohydrate kinase [Phnomibacter sp.]|nr:FGGY family carbohydrate kinase [Phnomibacter sp.]